MKRRPLSTLLGSLGLANLCALNLWHDCHRLRQPSVDYYRAAPAGDTLLAGTVLLVLALASLFFAIGLAAIGVKRTVASHWRRGAGKPLRVLAGLNLVFSPLFFVLVADSAIWKAYRKPSADAFAAPRGGPAFPARARSARVLWLVFDELDFTAAFPQRPEDLNLPELDRLRAESLFATDAHSPSDDTLSAMPALINGTPYSRVRIEGVKTLRLWGENGASRIWGGSDTVFAAARKLGADSAVAGWFHPYCRIFGGILAACTFEPGTNTPLLVREAYAAELGAPATAWYLLRSQFARLPLVPERLVPDPFVLARARHLKRFGELHKKALAHAADPQLGLVMLHYPVPHPYGIYDRKTARFSTSADATYPDNLALADRVVGELRRALEMNGLWENTAVVLSSDHSLRKWDAALIGWTPDRGSPASDGKGRIPFLVKLPGQTRPRTWLGKLNTIVTKPLILGILKGEVSTPDQLEDWLRSSGGSPEAAAL